MLILSHTHTCPSHYYRLQGAITPHPEARQICQQRPIYTKKRLANTSKETCKYVKRDLCTFQQTYEKGCAGSASHLGCDGKTLYSNTPHATTENDHDHVNSTARSALHSERVIKNHFIHMPHKPLQSRVVSLAPKCVHYKSFSHTVWCGVATISRLLKITGLFCKRALQNRLYSAKETYDFKEPTHRSHPICALPLFESQIF